MYLAQRVVVGGFGPWREAIDKVEALKPQHIVCGHLNKHLDDNAERTIAETRQYLDRADELLRTSPPPSTLQCDDRAIPKPLGPDGPLGRCQDALRRARTPRRGLR